MIAAIAILLTLLSLWSLVGIVTSIVAWTRWPCNTFVEDMFGYVQRLILALGFLALALK